MTTWKGIDFIVFKNEDLYLMFSFLFPMLILLYIK